MSQTPETLTAERLAELMRDFENEALDNMGAWPKAYYALTLDRSEFASLFAAAREAERLRLALNDIEKFRCPPGFDGEGATEFIRAIAIKALKGANP